MSTINVTTTLTTINCGECGGIYAIQERYRREKQEAGGFWTCPYCKCGWGFGKSENDRLKADLETERNRSRIWKERAQAEERSKIAVRGHLTRTKKRIAGGACPCCKRSFTNLARHMSTQHPDYAEQENEA